MNRLEKVFYDYLIKKGFKKEDIKFFRRDSPDFIVKNMGYEIKRKEGKSILLNKKQIQKILNKKIKSFIVAIDKEGNMFERILINKDILNKKRIDNINIRWEKESKNTEFFQKIDAKIVYNWKETITRNETIKKRLEEALKKDTEEHKNE